MKTLKFKNALTGKQIDIFPYGIQGFEEVNDKCTIIFCVFTRPGTGHVVEGNIEEIRKLYEESIKYTKE